MILRWNYPSFYYIEFSPRSLSLVPAVRIVGMQRKLPSLSSAFPPKRKPVPRTCAGFLLHFLSRHCKLRFAVCICTCEENEGLQREHLFAAGFPIGARAALLAHDFALQSLVCYTFASGWRGKGVGGVLCNRAECGSKRFFAAVGQADFVTGVTTQRRIFEKQNPTVRKRKRRYIKPAAATLPRLMASPSEAYPETDPPAALSGSRSDENESLHRSACARYRP